MWKPPCDGVLATTALPASACTSSACTCTRHRVVPGRDVADRAGQRASGRRPGARSRRGTSGRRPARGRRRRRRASTACRSPRPAAARGCRGARPSPRRRRRPGACARRGRPGPTPRARRAACGDRVGGLVVGDPRRAGDRRAVDRGDVLPQLADALPLAHPPGSAPGRRRRPPGAAARAAAHTSSQVGAGLDLQRHARSSVVGRCPDPAARPAAGPPGAGGDARSRPARRRPRTRFTRTSPGGTGPSQRPGTVRGEPTRRPPMTTRRDLPQPLPPRPVLGPALQGGAVGRRAHPARRRQRHRARALPRPRGPPRRSGCGREPAEGQNSTGMNVPTSRNPTRAVGRPRGAVEVVHVEAHHRGDRRAGPGPTTAAVPAVPRPWPRRSRVHPDALHLAGRGGGRPDLGLEERPAVVDPGEGPPLRRSARARARGRASRRRRRAG